jgi:hypothetical protein
VLAAFVQGTEPRPRTDLPGRIRDPHDRGARCADGARASAALSGIEERLSELTIQSGLGEATIGVTGDTTIAPN